MLDSKLLDSVNYLKRSMMLSKYCTVLSLFFIISKHGFLYQHRSQELRSYRKLSKFHSNKCSSPEHSQGNSIGHVRLDGTDDYSHFSLLHLPPPPPTHTQTTQHIARKCAGRYWFRYYTDWICKTTSMS